MSPLPSRPGSVSLFPPSMSFSLPLLLQTSAENSRMKSLVPCCCCWDSFDEALLHFQGALLIFNKCNNQKAALFGILFFLVFSNTILLSWKLETYLMRHVTPLCRKMMGSIVHCCTHNSKTTQFIAPESLHLHSPSGLCDRVTAQPKTSSTHITQSSCATCTW